MRQILFTNEKGTFDISTGHGKEAAFGRPQATPTIMTDESGEIICAYTHPEQIERNTALIKSIKAKYPGQPLRKAIDFYENELLLKAQQEKSEMMLKSKQVKPIIQKPQKHAKPEMVSEYLQRCLDKLESLSHSRL